MHAADIKTVLRVFSIEVPAREKDDLKEEPIVIKLRKVCTDFVFDKFLTHLHISSRLEVRVMTAFSWQHPSPRGFLHVFCSSLIPSIAFLGSII